MTVEERLKQQSFRRQRRAAENSFESSGGACQPEPRPTRHTSVGRDDVDAVLQPITLTAVLQPFRVTHLTIGSTQYIIVVAGDR